jgi:hypothetical protein
MLNHRLQVTIRSVSVPIKPQERETALGGNRLRRRARVGEGSSTTTGTAQVQPPSAKTPRGLRGPVGSTPRFPRTSLEPDAPLYRVNLHSAVG